MRAQTAVRNCGLRGGATRQLASTELIGSGCGGEFIWIHYPITLAAEKPAENFSGDFCWHGVVQSNPHSITMKSTIRSTALLLAGLLPLAALVAATAEKSAASAEAKAAYPMTTCVVSGDKLEPNSMGGPVDYTYKVQGKPDRLVRFCCKDCVKDFEKDPAKYLKQIDEAAAAKAAPKK